MAENKITVSSINKAIKRIREADLTPVTDLQMLQQTYTRILRPAGKSDKSGTVMPYNVAIQELHKRFPNAEFTKEQYQATLEDMYNTFENRFTVRGEKEYQINNMKTLIEDKIESGELEVKEGWEKLSFNELRNIFRQAKEMSSKKGDPNYNSNNFTTNLETLINERIPEE